MNVARYRRYHAEQKHALYALVDPVSPPPKPVRAGLGWRRRVLPPGPKGLLRRPFIAIAGLRRRSQYKRVRLLAEARPPWPAFTATRARGMSGQWPSRSPIPQP